MKKFNIYQLNELFYALEVGENNPHEDAKLLGDIDANYKTQALDWFEKKNKKELGQDSETKGFGWLVFIIGAVGSFFLIISMTMDTSVYVPATGRYVANIHLINQANNQMMIGFGGIALAIIIAIINKR